MILGLAIAAGATPAPSAGGSPGPIPFDGLLVWLDMALEGGVTIEEDKVAGIAPRGGTLVAAEQGDGAERPEYEAAGINGLPAANCGGFLSFTNINLLPIGASPRTIILVASSEKTTGIGAIYTQHGGPNESLMLGNVDGTTAYATLGSPPFHGYTETNEPWPSIPALGIFTYDGTNAILRINGVMQEEADAPALTTATDNAYIGAWPEIGGSGMDGLFGELIVYGRVLTVDEIASVSAYLNEKWGIA